MNHISPTFDSSLSDDEGLDSHDIHDGSEHELEGDYTAQMEALMEEDDDVPLASHEDDDSDEEDFVYSGVDANLPTSSYRDTLRDVLEQDLDESDEEREELEESVVHDISTHESKELQAKDGALVSLATLTLCRHAFISHSVHRTTKTIIITPTYC
jgi:hypothetical protein